MRVLVFGDSIVYGAWDSKGGWVERLKALAHETTIRSNGVVKHQIFNLGVGGDTSVKILKRLESEIESRKSENWPFVFVLTYGANDERFLNGREEVALREFEDNTRQIILTCKKYTDKIIFVGIPPLKNNVVIFKNHEYSNIRIGQYEEALKSIVIDHGLAFVDIRQAFENNDKNLLYSYDDLHPNDAGHALIARTLQPVLEEYLQ